MAANTNEEVVDQQPTVGLLQPGAYVVRGDSSYGHNALAIRVWNGIRWEDQRGEPLSDYKVERLTVVQKIDDPDAGPVKGAFSSDQQEAIVSIAMSLAPLIEKRAQALAAAMAAPEPEADEPEDDAEDDGADDDEDDDE